MWNLCNGNQLSYFSERKICTRKIFKVNYWNLGTADGFFRQNISVAHLHTIRDEDLCNR